MAYCFKRKESVPKAVRRLVSERLDRAVKALHDGRHAWAIHAVRREIKQIRSLLRLIRARASKHQYRRQMTLLRQAANLLAGSRDAHIKRQALNNLISHYRPELTPGAFRGVRQVLRSRFAEERKGFEANTNGCEVERLLRRLVENNDDLEVSAKGWKAIASGLKTSYRCGQRTYVFALDTPTPESLHEWRKRAKDLWHQERLLRRIWPEQMEAAAQELKALADILGDDHDLVILEESIKHLPFDSNQERELQILRGFIARRHRELSAEALALGARLYAETPSVFLGRLHSYWQRWRKGKDTPALNGGKNKRNRYLRAQPAVH